jgi:hypothetical protein
LIHGVPKSSRGFCKKNGGKIEEERGKYEKVKEIQ